MTRTPGPSLAVALIGLFLAGAASAQQTPPAYLPPEGAPEGANDGATTGRALLERERAGSFLQFDEAQQQWRYEIRRRDGTVRRDTLKPRELRPGGGELDTWADTPLAELHTLDEADLAQAGQAAKVRLEQSQDRQGDAYRAFRAGAGRAPGDLNEDEALWAQTDDNQSTLLAVAEAFGGCQYQRENVVSGAKVPANATDFRTCERYISRTQCARSRDVETVDYELPSSVHRRDNLLAPTIVEVPILEALPAGFSPGDVVVEYAWDGSVSNVDLEPPYLGNGWRARFDVQLDPTQFTCQGSCSVNDADCQCELTGVTQNVAIQMTATVMGVRGTQVSDPPGCLDSHDGFCRANWTCLDSEPRVINGVLIGAHNAGFTEPLYPFGANNTPPSSEDPFCWVAQAEYECNYNVGSAGCWTTPAGIQVCHENLPGAVIPPPGPDGLSTTCPLVDPDDECGEYAVECAENARGHGNTCYVNTVTLQCLEEYELEDVKTREVFACGGEETMRCMGDDCLRPETLRRREHAGGQMFTRARLQILQHLHTDYTYVDDRQREVWTMEGKVMRCRKGLGSELDHCNVELEQPMGAYLRLVNLVTKVDGALALLEELRLDPSLREDGAARRLRDPENHRWAELKRVLVSPSENITDDTSPAELMADAWSRVASDWGEEAADFLYGSGLPGRSATRSSLYRAKEAFDLAGEAQVPEEWMGTMEEWQLARSRSIGACLHVSSTCTRNDDQPLNGCSELIESYCCYDSHIARTLHEHRDTIAGLSLGHGGGEPGELSCPGFVTLPSGNAILPFEEVMAREARAGLDWRAVTLDEQINPDTLTGSRSNLGPANRRTTGSRARERLSALDTKAIRSTVGQELAARVEGAVDLEIGPGQVRLSPTLVHAQVRADRPGSARVSAYRHGSEGGLRVRLHVEPSVAVGYALPGRVVELSWAHGESGAKSVAIPLPAAQPWAGPFTMDAPMRIEVVEGGAVVAPFASEGRLQLVHRP